MVQLKLRFKEATRAEVEAAAKHRGISMNDEIVDRIQSGMTVEFWSGREFGSDVFMMFREYVSQVKLAVHNAGGDQNEWLAWAKCVPFPAQRGEAEFKKACATIAAAIDAQLREYKRLNQNYLKTHGGPPDPLDSRRLDADERPGKGTPASDFKSRAQWIKRVEENRRQRQGL